MEPKRLPIEDGHRGRVIAALREEGKEIVDEERLAQLILDLFPDWSYGIAEARVLARDGMEILRG